MSIEWLIYFADLASRKDVVIVLSLIVSVMALAAIFISTVEMDMGNYNDNAHIKTLKAKSILKISIITFLIVLLIPSQKAIYMIAGATLAKDAVQTETAIKLKKIIEIKLDSYLKDLEEQN